MAGFPITFAIRQLARDVNDPKQTQCRCAMFAGTSRCALHYFLDVAACIEHVRFTRKTLLVLIFTVCADTVIT